MPMLREPLANSREFLRGRAAGWSLRLLLLGAFVLLYACLFRFPLTPIFMGEDGNLFLVNATRMLDGERMYRDFFEMVAPGITFIDVAFFKAFGLRDWVANVSLLLVGLGLTGVIASISRRVLSGPAVFLPSVLFLTFAFVPQLDNTHHWFSALATLGAVAILIETRSPARLIAAGALCGLASFFTQTQGAFAVAGLAVFLSWEGRRTGQRWREILGRFGYVLASFVATVLATDAYFAWKAGPGRFFYCTVTFVWRYYHADREANSLLTLVYDFPEMTQWHDGLGLAKYLFAHVLVPLAYVWFWLRRRREAFSSNQESPLMLLSIVGSFLFAGVAFAPTTYRLCAVAPLALIVLVWLIRRSRRLSRVTMGILWVIALSIAVVFPLQTQRQKMQALDLPRGRVALDQANYEKLLWFSHRTSPGEFVFGPAEILFSLALRNPAEVPFLRPNDYTRLEQVRSVVAALERHQVRLFLWDMSLAFPGIADSGRARPMPPRGHLRSFLHNIKAFLLEDHQAKGDNLGPLRDYLLEHYHPAESVSGARVLERNQYTLMLPEAEHAMPGRAGSPGGERGPVSRGLLKPGW